MFFGVIGYKRLPRTYKVYGVTESTVYIYCASSCFVSNISGTAKNFPEHRPYDCIRYDKMQSFMLPLKSG